MNLNEKKPNKWWTEPDTFAMLALIEQMGLVHELDKKRQRNESLFRRLRLCLAKRGINFTVTQIRNRWKSLKHKYRKIKLASYRSPAARLSAVESFRYFHMLDHMLVRRPKVGGRDDDLTDGHALLGQSLADLDDHPDSPWPEGLIPKSAAESMSSKLDPDVDQSLNPDDMAGSEAPSWAVGPDEVMTLGLSGEYLYAVKTEPPSLCTPNGTESSRDAIDCSHNDLPGTSEETSSLILQQLTILNHRLGEQLAEQRAFHCSMLGMMDRQIQVLEQLSNFTRNHQPKLETQHTDSSVSPNVHEAQTQTLEPYPTFLMPKSQPTAAPWKVSLLEVHKRSPSELGIDTETPQTFQGCKENASSPPSLEISTSTENAVVQNGLCKHD
ncbi:uncharacterized protein LOC113091501 isoform X2 [Carassius auratus]|uniref:Uncharacterized protein LOC113091501 isoform X2 n=1 Tax=Carassius auratus TaxID=7957 RepID=A0A6P6NW38_CARAU|nr:uncharacterized protein LOC113091501 isoform X2 [Carassius auratus]XP_052433168.1 uncharacterized protein si:ch211-116o3.5 isoform X2 [Carassius gibelio]